MCSNSNNNNNNNCYFLYSTFVDVSLSETLLSSAGSPQSIENLCPSKEKGETERGGRERGREKEKEREGERRRKGEKDCL